ncbi:MAG: hypothetical protein AB7G23_01900 [Vicinamibacterales bacterium]|nr:hypothetical protein [Acidobacteriota bacterium]
MAKLTSELEIVCPCCQATLVVDLHLGRVVSHHAPAREGRPSLEDAAAFLRAEAERREAIFERSVEQEKSKGDALDKRFEEALRQASREPLARPTRDIDLD